MANTAAFPEAAMLSWYTKYSTAASLGFSVLFPFLLLRQTDLLMLSVIHFRIIWTYGDSVGFNVYVLALCRATERLHSCGFRLPFSVTFVCGEALTSFWLGQVCGPRPSHTTGKSAIQQQEKCHHWGLTNYTRHLRRKLSEHLAGSVFLAEAKGKLRVEETLLKAKWHLSLIQPSLSAENGHRALVVIGHRRKESSWHTPGP